MFPISWSSWDPAEHNTNPLVFCIVIFVLTFREEMGVWAACRGRNSARAVAPAVFLQAVWKQQAQSLSLCLLQRQDPAQHPGLERKVDSEVCSCFFFHPIFNSVSTHRCELTLPQRTRASPRAGAVWGGSVPKPTLVLRSLCVSAQSPRAALESPGTAPALQ